MILPADDSLALDASDDGPLVIDRNEPIFRTLDDLKQLLPAVLRKGSSTLRDAWLQTWGQMAITAQARLGFTLEAQWSPRFAESVWLDQWGQDLGKPRTPGEIDSDYRARLMGPVDVVSPSAIKSAVNAVLTAASPNSLPNVVYNEPSVDAAYCGPATTSDPVIVNSRQQTIGVLQTWFAFTQPGQSVTGSAPPNQTIYLNKNFRLWANYTGLGGNPNIGAFATPITGAQFWIIIQTLNGDDSLTPFCQPLTGLPGDTSSFDTGITGQTTPNQTNTQGSPANITTAYSYCSPVDSTFDKINVEVTRRKAAGVSWVVMDDYPSYLAI